jgi:hypothetical protein
LKSGRGFIRVFVLYSWMFLFPSPNYRSRDLGEAERVRRSLQLAALVVSPCFHYVLVFSLLEGGFIRALFVDVSFPLP